MNDVKRYAMRQSQVGKYICSLIMGIYDGGEWYHVYAKNGSEDVQFSGGFPDLHEAKKYYDWMCKAIKIKQSEVK